MILKKLIITADDFGASHCVNEEVERLHRAGFLTQASLMPDEPAAGEAVRIAQRNPGLTVGLHLTLCTDSAGKFTRSPVLANLRFLLDPRLGEMLGREIESQFARFRGHGFEGWYFDGHTHVHLNPAVFPVVLSAAIRNGFRAMRLVREPGTISPKPLVLRWLSGRVRPALESCGIRFADRVYGVSCTGRVNTRVVRNILNRLPAGLSEFYFHPGADRGELDTGSLLETMREAGIELTSWRRE